MFTFCTHQVSGKRLSTSHQSCGCCRCTEAKAGSAQQHELQELPSATSIQGDACAWQQLHLRLFYFAWSHSFLGHHGDHVVESSIVADENFQSLSLENVDSEDLTTVFNRQRGLRAFQAPVDFTFAISKPPMMLRWMQDLASRWFLKNTPASGTCRQHPRWFYLAWGWRPRSFNFFWSVRPWKNRTHPGRQMMAHGCTWIWQPMFDEFG